MKRKWIRRWIGRSPRGLRGLRERWRLARMKTPGWRRPFVLWAFVRRFPCWQVYLVLLLLSLAVRSAVPS